MPLHYNMTFIMHSTYIAPARQTKSLCFDLIIHVHTLLGFLNNNNILQQQLGTKTIFMQYTSQLHAQYILSLSLRPHGTINPP